MSADLPQIIAIEREASVQTYPHASTNITEESVRGWDWNYRQRRYQEALLDSPDGILLLAQLGQEAIGFAALFIKLDNCSHLKKLYVHPKHQGEGHGTLLLEHAEKSAIAHGALRMEVEVTDYNQGAIAFYERAGHRLMNNPGPEYMPSIDAHMTMLQYEKTLI